MLDGIILFFILSLASYLMGYGLLAASFAVIAECLVMLFAALLIGCIIYSLLHERRSLYQI